MKKDLPLRALPRFFLPGATTENPIEIPSDELKKLRKVLRLGNGDLIAVLPNDGTLIKARLDERTAVPLSVERVDTEARVNLTLAQALPKADKLDEVLRLGTEIGVSSFVLFPSARSIVRWDKSKLQERMRRLAAVVREAAEVSFRTIQPTIKQAENLEEIFQMEPDAIVLSEQQSVTRTLSEALAGRTNICLAIGPEGGWAPREVSLIGDRAVTLGPRVLRVGTAAAAACALALLSG